MSSSPMATEASTSISVMSQMMASKTANSCLKGSITIREISSNADSMLSIQAHQIRKDE